MAAFGLLGAGALRRVGGVDGGAVMKYVLVLMFISIDLSAFFSVPKPFRSQWYYVLPGGGLVCVYNYNHQGHPE